MFSTNECKIAFYGNQTEIIPVYKIITECERNGTHHLLPSFDSLLFLIAKC